MGKENTISDSLISSNIGELPEKLIAAAVSVNDAGIATHAGIIIRCDGETNLCHFTGQEIRLEPLPNNNSDSWYFHKDFIIVEHRFARSFLNHCQKIVSENTFTQPKWNFYYSGAYYVDGVRYQNVGEPNIITCVGFCIAVITGFIEEDEYIGYLDWTIDSLPSIAYANNLIAQIQKIYPYLTVDDISANLRRIKPDEYLASAYIKDLPVRKKETDKVLKILQPAITQKRIPASV